MNALEIYRPVFIKCTEIFPAKKKKPSRVNPAATVVVPLTTAAAIHTVRCPYVVSS